MTQRIFDEFSGLVLSVPTTYSTRQATLMPMSAERSLDMNGGDGPKSFDRGSRRCYGRPWRRPSGGRSVFQTPGATPALSNQFLAQFVTDTRRLGQALCATSLGNTVLDLSACLLPGWWSAGTPRRGLPSASRVTALSLARRRRRAGFDGAAHKRVVPDPSPTAAAEPTDTLSGAPDASTCDAQREAGLAQLPDPGGVIEPTDPQRGGNAPSCAPLPHPVSPVHPGPRLIHGSPGPILLRSAWRTRGGSLCACPPCSRSFVTSPGRKRSDLSDDFDVSMVFRGFPGVCHEARGRHGAAHAFY